MTFKQFELISNPYPSLSDKSLAFSGQAFFLIFQLCQISMLSTRPYLYTSEHQMETRESHTQKLKAMYESAPVNQIHFKGTRILFETDHVEISCQTNPSHHHAGGSVHGAVAFKLLDDAAYFSCQMLEMQFFLLTASFQIHFVRPVTTTRITAIGRIRQKSKNLFVAEARLFDERKKELAFGTGSFMKSTMELSSLETYD